MLGGMASVSVEKKKKAQISFCSIQISPIVLDTLFKVDHSDVEAAISMDYQRRLKRGSLE